MSEYNNESGKKHNKKYLTIILIALLVISCFLLGHFYTLYKTKSISAVSEATQMKEQLNSLATLISAEYLYTTVGKFENTSTFYGFKIPFSTKSFIVSYDGKITAGVDLSKADVVIRDKTITVKLPPSYIISNEIDEESLKVFDEKDGLFNPITITDYKNFAVDRKKEMQKKAQDSDILSLADENAKKVIKGLMSEYIKIGYTVIYETM